MPTIIDQNVWAASRIPTDFTPRMVDDVSDLPRNFIQ